MTSLVPPASRWPHLTLTEVPEPEVAAELAAAVRAAVMPGRRDGPLQDFRRLCDAGRFVISRTTLSAAAGQQEALLVPMDGDRFGICVDATPPGGWAKVRREIRPSLRRHRHRFRVAHEIAHTFFYKRSGGRPRRALAGSADEEQFCDEFARALLLPVRSVRRRPPTAAAVFSLHRDYAVSVEVAARAVAASHSDVNVALWYERPELGWCLQWTTTTEADAERLRSRARVEPTRRQAVAVVPAGR